MWRFERYCHGGEGGVEWKKVISAPSMFAVIVVDGFVYPSLLLLLGMLDFKLILQLCCSVPCACMLDIGLVIS